MTTPFEFFRSPITVYRLAAGTYINGRWTATTYTPIATTASIQPTTGEDLKVVPEGRRSGKTYKLYTSFRIQTVTYQNPDQVEINGERFEVVEVFTWQNNENFTIVNHYKYIAMNIDYIAPSDGT